MKNPDKEKGLKPVKEEKIKETEPKKGGKKNSVKKIAFPLFLALVVIALGLVVYLHWGWFVAASVNGEPISRLELIKQLEKQGGQQVIDSLVNKALVYQEAQKKNIQVSEKDIDGEYTKIEEQIKGQGLSMDDALASQGMTKEDLREELKYQLTVEKLLGDKLAVSDQEIKDYYEKNKDSFESGKKLEDLTDQIRQFLSSQKIAENYQSWLNEAKSAAKIKYFLKF